MLILLACTGANNPDNDGDTDEFGSDPRVDDTAVIPDGSFALSDAAVVDDDQDGAWSPGEAAEVQVVITNTGSEGFFHYPGVLLAVDNESVSIEADDWYLYGLEAGQSQTATFQVTAASTLDLETEIGFTASVHVLNCEGDECPDPAELSFSAVIEEDVPEDSGQ